MNSINQILEQNIAKLKLPKYDNNNPIMEIVEDTTLPKCEICNKPLAVAIQMFGKVGIYPCNCQCKKDAIREREEENREKDIQRGLDKFIGYSIMDADFRNCTFDKFIIDKENEKLYKLGVSYCKKWDTIFAENKGLLLYGTTGNGKTYLSSCIANELMKQNVSVLAISSIGILKKIQESYTSGYGEETETDIIQVLKQASLLIIDDLGAEYRAVNKDWTEKTLYSIIDARYRSKKPVIITTNLTPENLEKALISSDGINRTHNRLEEMVSFLKISCNSRRETLGSQKHDELMELLKL